MIRTRQAAVEAAALVWKMTFNALGKGPCLENARQSHKRRLWIKFSRVISTGKLNTLPCLHRRPIYQVVYLDPYAVLRRGESLSWEELGA